MKTPVHLNALRAFEASARHQSFSLAAEELNVTPAAVGQLVRSLEEVIGFPLFHRSNNRRAALVLTEPALRALPDIRMGFQSLNWDDAPAGGRDKRYSERNRQPCLCS